MQDRPFGVDDIADAFYTGERLRKVRSLMTDNAWLRHQQP
jgi:hypothetical protein